mgnify:CR=1 FL=1
MINYAKGVEKIMYKCRREGGVVLSVARWLFFIWIDV